MTNRMLSARHRRTLALVLLTVGLHLLGLVALVRHGGVADGVVSRPPPLMQARVIAAPAPEVAPAAAPPPPVLLPPPPVASLAPPPFEVAPAPAVSAPPLAPIAIDAGAAARLLDVESVQLAASPPPAEAASAAPAAPVGKAYRADVPPSATIVLEVLRKDADGTVWHGEAAMAWRQGDGQYKMTLEAGIRVLIARVNLVVLESVGQVDGGGFVPRSMTEKRRGRALTTTRFGQDERQITFSAAPARYRLLPGTQDKATIPLQLAAIARADSAQLQGNIDILVGEDKDAAVFRFVLAGQEEIDTPMGRLATWHLSRPPRAGAYGARLDIWLAPSLGWLPVRIDNLESNGATTTQTIKTISRPDAG